MASPQTSVATDDAVAQLCPQCAMCCNGVLFKDVELQRGDRATKLRALGLPVSNARIQKFPQPCPALNGCNCRIYADRPARCRDFECALLKDVIAGETNVPAALRVIRKTQRRVETVKRLLRELGETNELLALNLRFKRAQRRAEMSSLDEAAAAAFAELTLAFHDLNLLLRKRFFPSASD